MENNNKTRISFHELFDGAPHIHVITSRSGKILRVNKTTQSVLGYEPDDMTGRRISNFLEESSAIECEALLESLDHKMQDLNQSVRMIGRNGEIISALWDAEIILFPPTDLVYHIFKSVNSPWGVESGENGYLEKYILYKKIFETAVEGMVVTDLNGLIQQVNPAFTRITGYSEDEVKGTSIRMLKSGHHSREFYKEMWGQIMKMGFWQGEVWNKRKNGEIYPEWLTISKINNIAGIGAYYVGTFNDITDLKKSKQELQKQAYFDTLTGLPNRIYLYEEVKKNIEIGKLKNQQFAIFHMDLDNFKNYNESLGHAVGDVILQQSSQRIKEIIDEHEGVLARVGGDEFQLLINHTDGKQTIRKIADNLIKAFNETPIRIMKYDIYLSLSIGTCVFPEDGELADHLLRNTEMALFRAKELGKNRAIPFDESMVVKARRRMEIENYLRRAVDNRELVAHYQPKLELSSGRIVGMEVLVRWNSRDIGFVSPVEFIPVAEETGLIIGIGEWVLRESCHLMKKLIGMGLADNDGFDTISTAVNLSGKQFEQKSLPDMVQQILAETGVESKYLEFEITESTIIQDTEFAIDVMKRFNDMGIKISIDDFGTGYSSLAYLKKFPLDTVKIDRSFIIDIPGDKDDESIAKTIIDMAHNLGLKVVAEGVESRDQLDFLLLNSCDHIQGFLISKPLPENELIDLIIERRKIDSMEEIVTK